MKPRHILLAGVAIAAVPAGAMLPVSAMADPLPPAATYADLLEPVADAGMRLAADDANQAPAARLQPAQYMVGDRDHHHHHHHHHSRRWYRSNGYAWLGGRWVMRPRHDHHHHHHHHNNW